MNDKLKPTAVLGGRGGSISMLMLSVGLSLILLGPSHAHLLPGTENPEADSEGKVINKL